MRLTLEEVTKALASSVNTSSVSERLSSRIARHFNAGSEVRAVSTDTRTIGAGDLFVALRGERFDAHDYIAKAFDSGALAAVVDHIPPALPAEQQERCLVVPDTLAAFGQIARLWREKFDIPVVGVTGSVGKTTTKEMIALALSPLGPVLKSEKNENNEVGVPQTLLRLNETYKACVIEMGMRGRGQIAYLANIARPTIGVITVIGESHIELLGSREAIADAKAELLEALPESGFAVLSSDDPFFGHLHLKTKAQLIATSTLKPRGLHAEEIEPVGEGWRTMVCEPDGERAPLVLKSPARHDIANALLAIGVAIAAGVALRDAVNALQSYAPPAMRMESFITRSGAVVLNDSYNASPTSMKSALDTLAGYPGATRRIAFLGDMKELGDHSVALHQEVADFARSLKLSALYTVGEAMNEALPEASGHFATSGDAAKFAEHDLSTGPGDVVLVKGSRAMAMELIAEALRNK
jgi:UDP-N-acetylmuramoyl-tripeptide--D-alanyl-D-alanine ligase